VAHAVANDDIGTFGVEPAVDHRPVDQRRLRRARRSGRVARRQRIVDRDLACHAAIVRLLDNSRLDEFYAELTQELRFYLMVLSVEDREFENPGVVLAEHEAILSAIRSGPDHAVREVLAHIETNAERLKEIIAERE
jgi:DNA-binding FadR family transcriptional regulator